MFLLFCTSFCSSLSPQTFPTLNLILTNLPNGVSFSLTIDFLQLSTTDLRFRLRFHGTSTELSAILLRRFHRRRSQRLIPNPNPQSDPCSSGWFDCRSDERILFCCCCCSCSRFRFDCTAQTLTVAAASSRFLFSVGLRRIFSSIVLVWLWFVINHLLLRSWMESEFSRFWMWTGFAMKLKTRNLVAREEF